MGPIKRSAPRIYELILTLSDIEPPVWRRLRVSSGATLARAARIFAIAMGWNPGRPFAFTTGVLRFEGEGHRGNGRGVREASPAGDDPQDTRLRQVLPDAGSQLEFEYGEGHPWHLVVLLDRLLPPTWSGPWGYEEWRAERPSDSGSHTAVDPPRVPLRFDPGVVNAELEEL